MANLLTDFTAYDEIRAVLGVSDDEIEDQTLALKIYLSQLQLELSSISPDLELTYDTIKAASAQTATERKLVTIVEVFSAYAIAKILLGSAPLFAPKRISDGRGEMERQVDPFQILREEVNSMYYDLLKKLTAIAGVILLPITPVRYRAYALISPIGINPVTNV